MKTATRQITVTQDDIDNGVKENPFKCPVSLAVQRAFKDSGADEVSTSAMGISVRTEDKEISFANVPAIARLFYKAFDTGQYVSPFMFDAEFDLKEPEEEKLELTITMDQANALKSVLSSLTGDFSAGGPGAVLVSGQDSVYDKLSILGASPFKYTATGSITLKGWNS